MKFIILGLLALTLSAESFAQHRRGGRGGRGPVVTGPRYNPPGPVSRYDRYDHRRGPVVIHRRVGPGRTYRSYSRGPVIWSTGFGYTCGVRGDLGLNSRFIHDFYASYDCHQAISDIRIYGDFCNGGDLYDQSGFHEASFSSSFECRQALGYYY